MRYICRSVCLNVCVKNQGVLCSMCMYVDMYVYVLISPHHVWCMHGFYSYSGLSYLSLSFPTCNTHEVLLLQRTMFVYVKQSIGIFICAFYLLVNILGNYEEKSTTNLQEMYPQIHVFSVSFCSPLFSYMYICMCGLYG